MKSLIFNLVVVLLLIDRTSAQCDPAPTVNCIIYKDIQLKTFDGNIFGFVSQCSYTLLSMPTKSLTINYLRNPSGLQISYAGRIFLITVSGGVGSLTRDGVPQSITSTLNGVKFSQPGRLVIANIVALAMKIKYDGDTTEIILNNDATTPATRGLCSDNNGCTNDDLLLPNGQLTTSITTWADSWATSTCTSSAFNTACAQNQLAAAENYCLNLLNSAKFGNCDLISNAFMEICMSDYCRCDTASLDPMQCVCSGVDMYVRTCEVGLEVLVSWRDAQTCPISCGTSKAYLRCANNNKQLKCGEDEITNPALYDCEEGCYCPNALRLHNDQCIAVANCPCPYDNVEYPGGTVMNIECNPCTCNNGKWSCTNNDCMTWGQCIGDPHCTTFDGLYYDFQGQCMYYLVRGPGFDVICDHWAWNGVGYIKNIAATSASVCARVFVNIAGYTILLDQAKVAKVNGNTVWVPYFKPSFTITQPSSEFVIVTLWNGVKIAFNGQYYVRVGLPYNMHGDVTGLLGTFTDTTSDDFTKPDNSIGPNANDFGHSWKVPGSCEGEYTGPVTHPCTANPSREPNAIASCSPIQGNLFAGCSDNPTADFNNCVYDICYCTDDDPRCLCEHFANQEMQCARKGIFVDWRATITQCAITCPAGQTFQVCGNSCQRTCDDISLNTNCVQECYEGCNCPPGQSMNYLDQCVPISQCTCIYAGARFQAGSQFVDLDNLLTYTCEDGVWTIEDSTKTDIDTLPPINQCNAGNFEVYASCKRTNTLTCYNKHLEERPNFDNCVAGCECMDGYVFDTELGICVLPDNCPCMYKGISYPDGSDINNREEECICILGAWACQPVTNHMETCMVYGDIHVRSFDDTIFSFEGYCEYVVFSYQSPQFGSIRAVIETSSCSTGTCIQTAYIHRKPPNGLVENVIFNEDGSYVTSATLNNLVVTDLGATIVVDVVGAGLRFVWNRSGVLEVHAGPNWLTQTSTGLCGKYDNNPNNDIQVNGQNVAVTAFVDKYKLDRNCAGSTPIPDIDMLLPEDPCNYLTSPVFKTCSYLVDVQRYLKTCFKNAQQQKEIPPEQRRNHYCSPITAYATQCTDAGSPVNWRTSTMCPLQCDGNEVLYQCETPCPRENCANTSGYSCTDTVCVEACKSPNCPTGQIYLDATNTQCVAPNQCPATRRFARWG